MTPSPFPATPEAVQAAVAAALRWPENLGIELRSLHARVFRDQPVQALFVRGMADQELIRLRILEPLERLDPTRLKGARLTTADLHELLPAPLIHLTDDFTAVTQAVLNGSTALFLAGAAQAVVVDTESPTANPAGAPVSEEPYKDMFSADLMQNVALIRKRLRDPALMAEQHQLPHGRGTAAVVYFGGRADPDVLDEIRSWVENCGGEETTRRGMAGGIGAKFGFLPKFLASRWPDQAAMLLDSGYVTVIMNRVDFALLAPYTASALLSSGFDAAQKRPIGHILRFIRMALVFVVLLASASVVALMNYHQDLVPAPFLLAMAAVRETAPLPIALEVLLLELFQEMLREAGYHLPGRMQVGSALVAGKILILILVQGGVVGALQGAVSVGVAFAALGMLNYELIYLLRFWRFAMIGAAAAFGFFGMATLTFLFTMYLAQAKSFGVPFFGEPGLSLVAHSRVSSHQPGGKAHGP